MLARLQGTTAMPKTVPKSSKTGSPPRPSRIRRRFDRTRKLGVGFVLGLTLGLGLGLGLRLGLRLGVRVSVSGM